MCKFKNVAVNKFTQYVFNVGVDLTNKIPVPNQNTSFHGYMPKKECMQFVFLSPVLEEDIITTVTARLRVIITILIWS